jgi:hypothetical protein
LFGRCLLLLKENERTRKKEGFTVPLFGRLGLRPNVSTGGVVVVVVSSPPVVGGDVVVPSSVPSIVGNGIPLCHSHNVVRVVPSGSNSL